MCDATTGERDFVSRKLRDQAGPAIGRIVFCPDGRRLVTAHADRAIRVWDLKTGRINGRIEHPADVTDLAVFADGSRVMTSCSDGTIGIWNLETGQKLRETIVYVTPAVFDERVEAESRARTGINGVASISISPDGRRASFGSDNFMFLWDLELDEESTRANHAAPVRNVVFSADGRHVVSSAGAAVRVWALPPNRQPGEEPWLVEDAQLISYEAGPSYRPISAVAVISKDGRRVLSGGPGPSMTLWDRTTRRIIRHFQGNQAEVRSVAFAPDGRRALSQDSNKAVRLWNIESGEQIHVLEGFDTLIASAVLPDWTRIYTAGGRFRGRGFEIAAWDPITGRASGQLRGHSDHIWSLAVSPDGRYLLSGGYDPDPILWDTTNGREIRRFRGHTDKPHTVAFHPDGRRALSAGYDGTIRLWDVETGKELSIFRGHTSIVLAICVSPDGRLLFSQQWGRWELWIWDIDSAHLIEKINWRGKLPTRDSFTPDGRQFVCGRDRVVRMYRLRDPAPADRSAAASVEQK